MSVEAELADGTILEFPDGTDQSVIDRTVKRHVATAARAPAPKAATKPAPKVMSREAAIKAKAREYVTADDKGNLFKPGTFGNDVEQFGEAAAAGGANFFGLGPRIQAGISAVKDGVPYDEALTFWREANRVNREKSITGDIAGSLVTGGGALRAGGLALEGVTAAAPAVGNFLSGLATLQRGQKVANAAKIVGGGAAAGAGQAAGEGKDVGQGALIGAITAPIVTGGVKAATGVGRWVDDRAGGAISDLLNRDVVDEAYRLIAGLPAMREPRMAANASRHLRDLIRQNPNEVAAAQRQLSQRTGNNEPLVASLNAPDTRRVTEDLLQGSDAANEVSTRQSAGYIRSMMDRMRGHVDRAGANANGAPALQATIDDLALLRRETADNLMAPIQNDVVDLTQIPFTPQERAAIRQIGLNHPEIAPQIRRAFGPQRSNRPAVITIRQLDDLRQALDQARQAARNLPGQERHFENASRTLSTFARNQTPGYGDMLDAYAGHSRLMEGFETAAAGKRISDIGDTRLSNNLRTAEGNEGMKAGELFRLREAASKSPSSAINLARDLGDAGKLTRPASIAPGAGQPGTVTENIGGRAAADLTESSRAQTEVVDRMLQAQRINVNANNDADRVLDAPETALLAAGVASGGTMAITKARLLSRLIKWFPKGINPRVAANMTEMLFSSDPRQTQQAMNLLRRVGVTDQMVQSMLVPVVSGAKGGSEASPNPGTGMGDPNATPTMIDVGSGTEIPNPDYNPGPQSEYVSKREQIIASQPPGFADLLDRMKMAESSGQVDAVSDKGAEGTMQIMPKTGPDAARYAGVPYDRERILTDADYTDLLGTAYMAWLLPQFDGDTAKALAAYNDGIGDAMKYVNKPNWLSYAPQETRDYVTKILG